MAENDQVNNLFPFRRFHYISFGIGITAAIMFGAGIGEWIFSIIFTKDKFPELYRLSFGLAQLIFILIPTIYAIRSTPLPIDIMLRLKNFSGKQATAAVFGLAGLVMFLSGYSSIQNSLVPRSLEAVYNYLQNMTNQAYADLLGGSSFKDAAISIFIGALIPAVCEESLFRGFLQRSLEERLSPQSAIIITGLIFAFVHFNPVDFVPLALIGIFLGVLAYMTGSIFVPMIIHFLNNTFSILSYFSAGLSSLDSKMSAMPTLYSILFIIAGSLVLFGVAMILADDYRSRKSQSQPPRAMVD